VIPLYHFDDGAFKSDLYIRRIQDRDGPPWHLPRNVGADFMRQLTAEKLVERKNTRGAIESVWHQVHRDNHFGDCEKMQLVHGYLLASQLREKPQADTSEADEPEAARVLRGSNPLYRQLGINPHGWGPGNGFGRGWEI
jgi:phage terminase large subunit GpA-like protein